MLGGRRGCTGAPIIAILFVSLCFIALASIVVWAALQIPNPGKRPTYTVTACSPTPIVLISPTIRTILPTGTPTPSPTYAPTYTPYPTPAPILVTVIEDFNLYAGDSGRLRSTYNVNSAGGANDASIRLDNQDGSPVMALNYKIKADPSYDYIVVERCFSPVQDWNAAQYMEVWVQNDNNPKQLIVQFGEQRRCTNEIFRGEVWRTFVDLAPGQSGVVKLSLSAFHWANWSPLQNQRMELDKVGYFALGIRSPQSSSESTIYFGAARLLR